MGCAPGGIPSLRGETHPASLQSGAETTALWSGPQCGEPAVGPKLPLPGRKDGVGPEALTTGAQMRNQHCSSNNWYCY